jgi:predicted nucleic acid-binding protein
MILVDSNVIIDLLSQDVIWAPWSEAADHDDVAINPIIYAKVSSGFTMIEPWTLGVPQAALAV